MRVAIIDEDAGQLAVYNDLLEDYRPDLFDSVSKFDHVFCGQYDVIVLTHRYKDRSWLDVYNDLKDEDTLFIITATYNHGYYRKEFPNLFYKIYNEINKRKNVIFVPKPETNKIYDLIETRSLKDHALSIVKNM